MREQLQLFEIETAPAASTTPRASTTRRASTTTPRPRNCMIYPSKGDRRCEPDAPRPWPGELARLQLSPGVSSPVEVLASRGCQRVIVVVDAGGMREGPAMRVARRALEVDTGPRWVCRLVGRAQALKRARADGREMIVTPTMQRRLALEESETYVSRGLPWPGWIGP